ncbi:MAG TPA: hypothetical protein VFD03_12610, partial [Clostridia bacterium]|nr:hypothetical protein [Clostridia bacterium]
SSFILLLIIFLIGSPFIIGNNFDNLLKTNTYNITKVLMRDGSNGNSVSTTDKAKIQEIVQLVENRHYTKAINQEARTGYSYFYDFYVGNKEVLRITGGGNNVEINSTYYNVDKPIQTNELKNWFNSLPITK